MRKVLWWVAPILPVALAWAAGGPVTAQGLEKVTGKAFDGAVPHEFYLEGNAISTQKRNAVLLQATDGKRMLFGLLDTSGYAVDIQAKYAGMAIVEKKVSLGGATLGVGAWGFGLVKANPPGQEPAKLIFYDVAGQKVAETTVAYDAKLARPVPLQAVTEGGKTMLYLGRYGVALK